MFFLVLFFYWDLPLIISILKKIIKKISFWSLTLAIQICRCYIWDLYHLSPQRILKPLGSKVMAKKVIVQPQLWYFFLKYITLTQMLEKWVDVTGMLTKYLWGEIWFWIAEMNTFKCQNKSGKIMLINTR